MRSLTSALMFLAALLASLAFATPTFAQTATAPYLDANGWTVFTPVPGTGSCASGTYTGTCVVYVSSSSGNDSTCAPVTATSTSFTPCATLAKGISLLRNDHPDWLLLKRGDTWLNQDFSSLSRLSGQSATAPMVIGSYDPSEPGVVDPYVAGARPLMRPNPSATGSVFFSDNGLGSTINNNTGGNFLAIVGIEFYNYTRDPNNASFNSSLPDMQGIFFLNPITWLLIEDCKFSFFANNISLQLDYYTFLPGTVTIRRNVIVDAYSTDSHSQGIFTSGISNLVIEENVLDHNGWDASVAGAGPTVFNRNLYDHQDGTTGLTFVGNISSNSSSQGAQFRNGGTVTNNLFVANDAAGFDVGHQASDSGLVITSATVQNNVIEQTNGAIADWATGINILNASGSGIQVTNNIIAQNASTNATALYADSTTASVVATNNIIYNWGTGAISDNGTGDIMSPNAVNASGYPNPNLTVATYDTTLGGPGTLADFIAQARDQSKANWNPALTADAVNTYIRAGFGITSTTPTPTPTPTPTSTPAPDTTPPSTPPGLTATAVSATTVSLTWSASTDPTVSGQTTSGVAGYDVYRNGVEVGSTPSTSYSDTSLSASTSYTYTVAAYDNAGNTSAQSASVSVTTPASGTTPTTTTPTTPSTPSTPSSTSFTIGEEVETTATVNVRTSPSGTPSGSRQWGEQTGLQREGAIGTIVAGPETGSGYTWWQVNFTSGPDGWVAQNYLAAATAPAPTPTTPSQNPGPSHQQQQQQNGSRSKLFSQALQTVDSLIAELTTLRASLVAGAAGALPGQ